MTIATPQPRFTGLALLLTCILTLVFAANARAQDAAKLAPPEAAVFIQIDDLATLRADYANDPLITELRKRLNLDREPEGWVLLKAAMGMNSAELIDTYFGKSLVLIAKEEGDGKPGVILSRVKPAAAQDVITSLALRQVRSFGDFTLYTNDLGDLNLAFSNEWMAFSDVAHAKYMEEVLSRDAKAKSLADDKTFAAWMKKMPAERFGTAFIRKPADDATGKGPETHALALVRKDQTITARYIGSTSDIANLLVAMPQRGTMNLGPVPAGVMAAVSVNIQPKAPKDSRMIDRVLAPKTLAGDVLPKIGDSIVLFAAAAPLETAKTAEAPVVANDVDAAVVPLALPMLGLAVELKDPSVTPQLDRILNSALLLLNLKTVEWEIDPITLGTATHIATTYHTADLGTPMSQRAQRPELKQLQLAFGQVGSWYVLTTNPALMNQTIDAIVPPPTSPAVATGAKLVNEPALTDLGLKAKDGLMATALMRTPAIAAQLQAIHAAWEVRTGDDSVPAKPRQARIMRAVNTAVLVLEHFQTAGLQLSAIDDNTITIDLTLQRKAAE